MMRQLLQNFLSSILLFGILVSSASLPAAAQTRRANAGDQAGQQKPSAVCTGAWSGIVKYERLFDDAFSEEKTYQNYGGSYAKTRRTQRRQITGRIILDGKGDPAMPGMAMNVGGMMMGASTQTGRTGVTVVETENETGQTVTNDSCGWESRQKKCDHSRNRRGQTSAEGRDQFFLQFQGGTYGFSFRLPEANGTVETVERNSCTGLCRGDTNNNQTKVDPVRYDREPVSVKNQQFDPKNPDRLRGSFWDTSADKKTTTFVSWNLRRCAPPLQLIDMRFYHHDFPDDREWVDFDGKSGTIDGNYVRIVARVLNTSTAAQTATLNFSEKDEQLASPNVTTSVAGGEMKDVEYFWDTRGFAWDGSGAPHSDRRIRIRMNGETIEEDILVKPKPVVLVAGYWTKPDAWKLYADFLKKAHGEHWQASPVGGVAKSGRPFDPNGSFHENAVHIKEHVSALRERANAWHVDMVAHSTGGLAARHYIHGMMPEVYDKRAEVAHLVMLGTPNNGTPCANIFTKNDLIAGRPGIAMRELMASEMQIFNRNVYKRNLTRFSALAGSVSPVTCVSFSGGDGFVPVESATHNIEDAWSVRSTHQGLTGENEFKNFVKRRLDLSPQLARQEEAEYNGKNRADEENPAANRSIEAVRPIPATWQASATPAIFSNPQTDAADETMPGLTLSTAVKVRAGEKTEIDVPVLTGARAAVVLLAEENVSATLSDNNGKVLGASAGADSGQIFRTIPVERPSAGNLKLRLENSGAGEAIVLVAAWTDTDPLQFTVSAGPPGAAGTIALSAKLTMHDAPVLGAVVKAAVLGRKAEIVFLDDGKNGDGPAGDGIYGAKLEKLPPGDYLVTARAESGGQIRAASAEFKIGR